MKKLMILGGSKYIIPVIRKAHERGIFVITCDYLPNNYAHQFSDKYINVSIIDKDKVLDVAKKEEIDGIISFACDPGVITASYVAEKLGLPNVAPYESVCVLQNKNLFRSFLKEHGFNVPWFKSFSNINDAYQNLEHTNFPIIVKPTDSAGSKGVSVVYKKEELFKALTNAFDNSRKKEVIAEEFIVFKGHPSDADTFVENGEIKYFGIDSQLFDKDSINPFTPAGYYWPSEISNESQVLLKSELNRLFKLLKINNAILNIELRENISGKPYIMEVSPRGGGNRLSEMIEYGTKQDIIGKYIEIAVNFEKYKPSQIKQIQFDDGWCLIILHSNKEGRFDSIIINQTIKRYLVDEQIWLTKGDHVSCFSGANQTIGTLIFKFENKEQMLHFLNNQSDYIEVNVQ